MNVPYRGRLAPSPTGLLHLGHASTFYLAWLAARSTNGELRLRFEDLDRARSKPIFADQIQRDLEWFGLDWDGLPLYQSHRESHYESLAQFLEEKGDAFACICTRGDINNDISAPHQNTAAYSGKCRNKFSSRAEASTQSHRQAGLRLRLDGNIEQSFEDRIFGRYTAKHEGEFVDPLIVRRDGIVSYLLSVVIDDIEQGITEVVRGRDLLDNTLEQLHLYQLLGKKAPSWFHCPLFLDEQGIRLSKRHDSLSLSYLRDTNFHPVTLKRNLLRSLNLPLSWAEEVPSSEEFEKALPKLTRENMACSDVVAI